MDTINWFANNYAEGIISYQELKFAITMLLSMVNKGFKKNRTSAMSNLAEREIES